MERHKPAAEMEFDNTLLLAQNPQGLIIDWELFRQSAPADAHFLPPSVRRMEQVLRQPLKALAADRSFDSELNRVGLKAD